MRKPAPRRSLITALTAALRKHTAEHTECANFVNNMMNTNDTTSQFDPGISNDNKGYVRTCISVLFLVPLLACLTRSLHAIPDRDLYCSC